MFPSRITGPIGGPFAHSGISGRLGSIVRFYIALGVCGAVLVLVYYALASATTPGPTEILLTGPLLYLTMAWGVITAIFIGLLIWRSLLASREDDEILLDAAEEHMAREQGEYVARISSLSRPIATSGIASGLLLLVIAGLWLYTR